MVQYRASIFSYARVAQLPWEQVQLLRASFARKRCRSVLEAAEAGSGKKTPNPNS